MTTHRPIAEIEAELAAARAAEAAAKKAAAAAVTPQWRHIVEPVADNFDRLHDDTCRWYRLSGVVTNKDELAAVGKEPREGSMKYLYNTLSARIVMRGGGGTVFFSDRDEATYAKLSAFIESHPEGGDVTGIIADAERGL